MMRVVPSMIVTFIADAFPDPTKCERFGYPNLPGNLSGLAALVDQLPEALWPIDPVVSTRLRRAQAAIRMTLDLWSHRGTPRDVTIQRIPEGHPIVVIADCLEGIPDNLAIDSVALFPFVSDAKLRDQLAQDMASAEAAIGAGQWRVATVFAGASIEAILFNKIIDAGGAQSQAIAAAARASRITKKSDSWGLYEYVTVGHQSGWLDCETRNLLLAVKNFRNLIHADRVVRTNEACDSDTAHIAYGCAQRLIKRFS